METWAGKAFEDADETGTSVLNTTAATSVLEPGSPSTSTKKVRWAGRFTNVTVAKGAKIVSAKLKVWVPAGGVVTAKEIYAEIQNISAPSFTEVAHISAGREYTKESTVWKPTLKAAAFNEVSVAHAVEEAVKSKTWVSGGALLAQLTLRLETGTLGITISNREEAVEAHYAELVIEWEPASGVTTAGKTTFVSASKAAAQTLSATTAKTRFAFSSQAGPRTVFTATGKTRFVTVGQAASRTVSATAGKTQFQSAAQATPRTTAMAAGTSRTVFTSRAASLTVAGIAARVAVTFTGRATALTASVTATVARFVIALKGNAETAKAITKRRVASFILWFDDQDE